MRGTGRTRAEGQVRIGLVFSGLVLVGLSIWFGPGLHLVLLAVLVLPMANLFFLGRIRGIAVDILARIAVRSLGFGLAVFLTCIVLVRLFGLGQLGYGDALAMEGRHLTATGYLLLAKVAAGLAGLVSLAAFLSEMPLKRGLL